MKGTPPMAHPTHLGHHAGRDSSAKSSAAVQITIFGDWHGNTHFAQRALSVASLLRPDSHLLHLGDFSLWPGDYGARYLHEINDALSTPLLVVPGNHEYWTEIYLGSTVFGFSDLDDNGFLYTPRYPNIRVCERTAVWSWDGITLAALAGANSIDFQHRTKGKSWWPEESPTMAHVDQLDAHVNGRPIDVLATHDAPSDAVRALNLYPPETQADWSTAAITYASESADVVEAARRRLRPRIQACGHHHVRKTCVLDDTTIELLADDSNRSIRGNRLDLNLTPPEHARAHPQ